MWCGQARRRRGSGFAAFVLLCVAIFLAARGNAFPAVIALAIAANKGLRWWHNPERLVRASILSDAMQSQVRIPDDAVVWDSLNRLYAMYQRTSRTYAPLSGSYGAIIASMWATLRTTHDLREWRRIVASVMHEWPTPQGGGEDPLKVSLSNAKAAARRWQEAHREAHQSSL